MKLLLERTEVADRPFEPIVLEHHGGVAGERLEESDVLRSVSRRRALAVPDDQEPVDSALTAEGNGDRAAKAEIGHQAMQAVARIGSAYLSDAVGIDLGADARGPVVPQRARFQG